MGCVDSRVEEKDDRNIHTDVMKLFDDYNRYVAKYNQDIPESYCKMKQLVSINGTNHTLLEYYDTTYRRNEAIKLYNKVLNDEYNRGLADKQSINISIHI